MTLYLTLYEDGNAQPNGFKGETKGYGSVHGVNDESNGISHEACADCEEDRETQLRLDMALTALVSLGYEAMFSSEPSPADVSYEEEVKP